MMLTKSCSGFEVGSDQLENDPLQFADWFRFLLSQAFLQTILLALNIMCKIECVCACVRESERESD